MPYGQQYSVSRNYEKKFYDYSCEQQKQQIPDPCLLRLQQYLGKHEFDDHSTRQQQTSQKAGFGKRI
jgi:hypothetical protein